MKTGALYPNQFVNVKLQVNLPGGRAHRAQLRRCRTTTCTWCATDGTGGAAPCARGRGRWRPRERAGRAAGGRPRGGGRHGPPARRHQGHGDRRRGCRGEAGARRARGQPAPRRIVEKPHARAARKALQDGPGGAAGLHPQPARGACRAGPGIGCIGCGIAPTPGACHEPVAHLHPAPGRHLAAHGGGADRRAAGLPAAAHLGPARGGLPHHPGHHAVPRRQPRRDDLQRHRAAGAPVRPDAGAGRRCRPPARAGPRSSRCALRWTMALDVAEQQVQAAINAGSNLLPSDLPMPPLVQQGEPGRCARSSRWPSPRPRCR